ncbi:5-oxoprolinase subunit C family protein [Chelatococcus asaccharovorans]|uniref:5-oxoprolinase subunit C family protein n=1 Tax=Chelatococcus asaccharovorans TaxID=28210 RepID=UPI00224C75D9|nr:biotin-dependent carboxyltransferase family protein [Chelatococcus asaccharovorans]CAH1672885.1 putative 5-oxoprolinase subunit C [Chelatococcus asaccharovorans]CAH1675726.1 putative 5-oxoprolinase subunit C [Chelatococcus asaccharovorans]
MIEVLTSFALNTVQDKGRVGVRRFGVSTSGVMDPLALTVGNTLLGNDENAACIEVQTFPFRIRFTIDCAFAVTGADCMARLGEVSLPPWWCAQAKAGDVLQLNAPKRGARGYITFRGGLDLPLILGSRSTHLRSGFGGFEGRPLMAGDVLPLCSAAAPAEGRVGFGAEPPDIAIPAPVDGKALQVRALRAGEYDLFPTAMQDLFWSTPWKIGMQSDRGGYRLAGPKLLLPEPVEMRSHGVVPGVIQVPPAGEPIVQMSDANTAGGYPKIAAVVQADLWRLGQAKPGSFVTFKGVSYREAVAAMDPVENYLARVGATSALYRAL